MNRTLFSAGTSVFRGNLHGHSTHSDGREDTGEVVRRYREAGYDFTCLSDHLWTDPRFTAETVNDSSAHDCDGFITIISAELHAAANSMTRTVCGILWRTACPPISPLPASAKPRRNSCGARLMPVLLSPLPIRNGTR